MADYDIPASSLVLLGCLAKRKRTINRRVEKRFDMEQLISSSWNSVCEGGSGNGKRPHGSGHGLQGGCGAAAARLCQVGQTDRRTHRGIAECPATTTA